MPLFPVIWVSGCCPGACQLLPAICATLPTSRLPNRRADKSHTTKQVPNPILLRWWHLTPNNSQSVPLARRPHATLSSPMLLSLSTAHEWHQPRTQ
ncbi:hypothetical protein BDP55DRAFT_684240 [Colletotrichum godetiae]|uniref:Uncharacterized protein n=1 Tax=Colletotrichum godetiae TaxID=1209918 RepID=A0AAJ0EMT9_9PEZI|nr:uncharacterized protein BDP55DRAFT_684240 [Colletotrichum godetiae]KAK1657841.1 hypothetical protein BDP55DRAFT_684240 [Colletotrichum godetiae]